MDRLVDLHDVVRRVVAARIRQPQLVDDLTQETLAHLAAAAPELDDDAQQAYAVVTARNVVASHLRRSAVTERNAHRLVDVAHVDDPEHTALMKEEAAALTEAMRQLTVDERELLLRHEVHGDDIAAIARETGTTSGATTMRLARARARLRLEFVLTFRRIRLPSPQCRPVLLALAAGDRRQQGRTRSAAHVASCPTCAVLAAPVSERRRGIAAWLIVPAAEALRRLGRSLRRDRITQVALVAAAATATAVGIVLARPDPPARTATVEATAPATTDPRPPTTVATTAAPAAPAATVPPCPPGSSFDQLQPGPTFGCPVSSTDLVVTAVPSDEGFWARSAAGREVWVQLVGSGESPFEVTQGAAVNVTGISADPAATGAVADDPRVVQLGFVLHVPYEQLTVG